MEKELDESQEKHNKLKDDYYWLESQLNDVKEENDVKEDKIDQEQDVIRDVNQLHTQKLKQLQMKLKEKDDTIIGLEEALESERQATDSIEHDK
jgi:chromosome segregation ATPase